MDWKDNFSAVILKRGLDYFERGSVSELTNDGESIRAVVDGSEPYNVHIELRGGEIHEMYCDCPYAVEDNCKHMAAVLYALEDAGNDEPTSQPVYYKDVESERISGEQAAVNDLLEASDISDLKAFIREAVRCDDGLRRRFLLRFSDGIDDNQINECIRLVKRTFGRSDYYDYEESVLKLTTVVDTLKEITRRKKLKMAFRLATELYNDMTGCEWYPDYSYDNDDYCGDLYDIADVCIDTFSAIIAGGGELSDRLFDWIAERVDGIEGCEDDEYSHKLALLFNQNFNQTEYLPRKLKIIDDIVAGYDLPNINSYGSGDYRLSWWVRQRLSVMRRLGMKTADYQRRFWQLSDVRVEHIDRLIREKSITEAIDALNESIEIDSDKRGLVIEHTRKLKVLYQKQPDIEKYREMLWKLVCVLKTGYIAEYYELKELYSPDEWMIERERVFDSLKGQGSIFLNQLYIEEGLLDRLLEWVKNNASISNLNLYFAELMNEYPAELLELYSQAVRRSAYVANSRPRYKELTNNLKTISCFPNGKAVAVEIADEWRRLFPRRRAMMDELQSAGY